MAINNITPLPAAPSRNDAPQDFTNKADQFVAALPKLVTELRAANKTPLNLSLAMSTIEA